MTGRRITTARTAACGLTVAALLAASACGGSSGKSGASADGKAAGGGAATSSSPAATPQSVAQAFLAAWSSGDFAGAGALTDDPTNATNRLKAIAGSLNAQKVQITLGAQEDTSATGGSGSTSGSGSASGSSAPTAASGSSGAPPAPAPASPSGSSSGSASGSAGTPTGGSSGSAAPLARFAFNVVDTFAGNLTWPYQSSLSLVQGPAGTPVVHWSSAVINPYLGGTALLKAVAPKQNVVDSTGAAIDVTKHPTLASAVNALSTHAPATATPTQLTVEFVDPKTNNQIANSRSWPLGTAGGPTPTLKTTIDPKVQSALESALTSWKNSGMVAIQPSTGYILGMASNDSSFNSLAYQGTRAPGSTFKTITTALALSQGLKTTDPVNCSPTATVEGKEINNDASLRGGMSPATLRDAFLVSCNTAYVHLAMDGKLGSDYSALTNEAKTYFGMNQKWDLGMGPATYGTPGDQQVPPANGKGLFAREAFGQGDITMSPLTMASVAATVDTGQFKQPILVPGTPQIPATPLPPAVDSQLISLMEGVVNSDEGTASTVFPHNIGIGAKTGSAEAADTPTTDSWMIVFDKPHDIAFCALVLNGGMGFQAAGPAIKSALGSLGYL